MACGLLAIIAARAARDGGSLAEIDELVREAIPRTVTFGVFGTLEYLARGGRLGRGQAFLGTLLKINPILAIRKGEVVPVERVRTRARALERLCRLVQTMGKLREMSVMGTTRPEEAEELVRRLSPGFPPERVYRASIGPTMGTQVGPDAVGVALIAEEPVRLPA
jgi:DegV family protein with EDD domain